MSVEILHITVGQLRAIPEEIRKKYVSDWLELHETLPSYTRVDVLPGLVSVVGVHEPEYSPTAKGNK